MKKGTAVLLTMLGGVAASAIMAAGASFLLAIGVVLIVAVALLAARFVRKISLKHELEYGIKFPMFLFCFCGVPAIVWGAAVALVLYLDDIGFFGSDFGGLLELVFAFYALLSAVVLLAVLLLQHGIEWLVERRQ